jgi:hypothetical protein
MSDQNTLSRRRALSLLGATALTAQTAAARSQDVIAAATSTRPRYIFGYGSLIERESRMATWPSAQFASPVIVKGVARGWFDQTDVPSWSPTYLGGIPEANAETNGVIFRVTSAEFDSYTQRETGYGPTQIDPSQITMLDGSSAAPDGDIWYFANARKDFPLRRASNRAVVCGRMPRRLPGNRGNVSTGKAGQLRRAFRQDDKQLGTAMDQ